MRLIKKYSNGRFFDTEAKKYIKTEEMADLVKKGEEMKITLTKTGRDVTKSVIAQFTKEESDQKKTSASKGKKAKAAAAKGKTKKKTDKKKTNKKTQKIINSKTKIIFLKRAFIR
eukprot:Anaeramoba_ignava/c19603_g1_i1.p2 GENE.c19603_g1_i1~~c19603_g1_i1.p2  ORF type:complete len:115 (+),score=19.45 c19603_g1_i1:712-1056(+)